MLEPGAVLEGYRIDGLIGEGGMGVVYEATQLSVDRKVALKLLAPQLSRDAAFRRHFEREGRLRIDHPNIVTVLEAGESDYGLFIAMELIRGTSLKELILGGEIEVDRTRRILGQVADALDKAHDAGLIHRDIKPHNILVRVRRRDHAYLGDLGVTKDRTRTGLTGMGATAGTIDYIAPEQIRGDPTTTKVDIYSLGAVLYECLSGTVPFPRDSEVAVLYAHVADPPPRLADHRPELPDDLDAIVATAMAKDPTDRYETAGEMVEALERVLDGAAKATLTPAPISVAVETAIREDEPTPAQPADQSIPAAMESEKAGVERIEEQSWAPPRPRVTETTPAAAPAESDTAAPPGERGRRAALFWAGAGAAIVALAAVGFIAGRDGSKETPSLPSSVSVDGVALKLPDGWRRLADPPAIAGVTYPGSFAVAPEAGAVMLVAAPATGRWPTLLPASFERRAPSRSYLLRRQDVVRLGKREAFRYRTVKLRGAPGSVTSFVVPNGAKKIELLSCVGSVSASTAAWRRCEGVAATVGLPVEKEYSLFPQAGYARLLDRAITRLTAARAAGLRKLAAAGTAADQARAARAVAAAFSREAQRLDKQRTSPLVAPVNGKLVATLRSIRVAYAAVAAAAAREDSQAYAAATASVRAREAELRGVLADLTSVGILAE